MSALEAAQGGRPASRLRAPALVIGVAAAVGALVVVKVDVALLCVGAAALVALGLALARARYVPTLGGLLIGSTFVTRFRVDLAGFGFRIEHVVLLVALVALFAQGRLSLRTVRETRVVVIFLVYVGWLAIVSALRSPDVVESFGIVGWLALSVTLLLVVLNTYETADDIIIVGSRWATAAFASAIVMWVVAAFGSGGFGVQTEPATGALAAYGLSYEANILGSTAAIWLFIALTARPEVKQHMVRAMAPLALACVLISLTRAALLGLVLGVAVWSVLEGGRAAFAGIRRLILIAAAASAVLLSVPGVISPLIERISQIGDVQTGTGATRLFSVRSAFGDLGQGNWLIGLGTNSYGQRHLEPTLPGQGVQAYLGSLPVEILYGGGAIAVALVIAAFLSLEPWRILDVGRAAGLLTCFGITSLATSTFWFGSTWLLIAMAIRARRRP